MSWGKYKLADVCNSIADGDHQPPPKADSGIPFVTISNITNNNKFDLTDTMFVPQEYYDGLDDKKKARIGDILYSVVGSFGIPVFMNEEQKFVFQRHIAILRPDREKIVPEFLFYTMLNRDFYMKADAVALGAAQRTISLTALRGIEIEIPPYKMQEKIVNILKPFDDIIENNQKQLKLLEEAAQRLYKEWFVDLRFPGYEKYDIVDGVPEGWKKEKLVDLCDVQYGYAFDGTLFNNKGNGTPIIRIRNIPPGITGDYTPENADDQYRVQNGEIIVGMDGEFHINSWCGETSYLVQRTCCIRPYDKAIHGWLLWAIRDPIKYFEKTVVGATVSHLGKKHIDTIELLRAPNKMYEPFDVYFKKRQLLLNQNRKLIEMRDRLLPKLMGGEIVV
ncbi:restriction endonuclease subunit S [Parablautia muri]|uniref:Restriction endonuclease subunit S n=1 Tax=Parablautia muri TaxID=2320879 RepID=A0A9X5GSA4_9FIRM|nr:restriction endonuclease subunit S [Parablautia muri]NBJ92921.1 restriction endonuclease subunit S [Parablautia muri]